MGTEDVLEPLRHVLMRWASVNGKATMQPPKSETQANTIRQLPAHGREELLSEFRWFQCCPPRRCTHSSRPTSPLKNIADPTARTSSWPRCSSAATAVAIAHVPCCRQVMKSGTSDASRPLISRFALFLPFGGSGVPAGSGTWLGGATRVLGVPRVAKRTGWRVGCRVRRIAE